MWAFLVGGAICTAGQGLSNLYQLWGMDQDVAGGAVTITLILAAELLVLTRWCKPTKGLHPIVFILASAIIGVVFSF